VNIQKQRECRRNAPTADDLVERERHTNEVLLVKYCVGSLLPGLSRSKLPQIQSVLEIGCGPGTWTQEMGRAYEGIARIIGVDTRRTMLMYAKEQARCQQLADISYEQIENLAGPFPFPDASFDLISGQFLGRRLLSASWPCLLGECFRLLRPGGLLHLTEFEAGLSNAPAHEELTELYLRAMQRAGRSFSPTDRHLGLICTLEPMVRDAGFVGCTSTAHIINYSYGTVLHEEWKNNLLLLSRLAQPLLVRLGGVSEARLEALSRQQQQEMDHPGFHAMLFLLTLVGTKAAR
jgi:ubiquinone/menaquinone biosynthesis C-methylase UbiE